MVAIDWVVVARLFRPDPGPGLVGHSAEQGHRHGLLSGRSPPGLVRCRRVDLCLEHRLGAPRGPGRLGRDDGVAMAHFELHAWCLLVLAWVMIPFYMRSKVFTMPEFLERRFSPAARTMLSVISLVAYVITKIAVGIYAGGMVAATLLPEWRLESVLACTLDSFWIGSVLVVLLTGLYTVLGGMRAVAYTEALQTIILIIGSALVTIFGLQAVGGWEELRSIAGQRDVQPVEAGRAAGRIALGADQGSERQRRGRRRRPGTSTAIIRGWGCCSVRRSSACGIGAPISTSCSGRWARRMKHRPAAARFSPRT